MEPSPARVLRLLPGGSVVAHADCDINHPTRVRWFIQSAVILDTQFLASPSDTEDFVSGFSQSFAENSKLTFTGWQETAPAAVGERARMYSFSYQANEDAGVAGSDLAEGDGALVV